jgi:hypothetical protein
MKDLEKRKDLLAVSLILVVMGFVWLSGGSNNDFTGKVMTTRPQFNCPLLTDDVQCGEESGIGWDKDVTLALSKAHTACVESNGNSYCAALENQESMSNSLDCNVNPTCSPSSVSLDRCTPIHCVYTNDDGESTEFEPDCLVKDPKNCYPQPIDPDFPVLIGGWTCTMKGLYDIRDSCV